MSSKISRYKEYREKKARKDLATWVHRYLRLHSELLEDKIYKDIYDHFRNELITYLREDVDNDKTITDAELGNLADILANIFNEHEAERVNKEKPTVNLLYEIWKYDENTTNNID